jgi:hypothetical protein
MNIITQNRNIILIALATALILLPPVIGMLISDEVVWGPEDFVFAAALIFGTGLTYELVTRNRSNMAFRAAVGIVLAAALLLVWAELAVGIWD